MYSSPKMIKRWEQSWSDQFLLLTTYIYCFIPMRIFTLKPRFKLRLFWLHAFKLESDKLLVTYSHIGLHCAYRFSTKSDINEMQTESSLLTVLLLGGLHRSLFILYRLLLLHIIIQYHNGINIILWSLYMFMTYCKTA